jgi:hypothetical protein
MKPRKCEQQCGADAQCYAGGKHMHDWAGYYCYKCQESLKFIIFNNYKSKRKR